MQGPLPISGKCVLYYIKVLTIMCFTQYNFCEVINLKDTDEMLDSLVMELRRGAVILGVLSRLFESQYGYSLVQDLEAKGFAIEPGTLYPLLRRLEKQGLLESSWDTSESRPRRYYRLSSRGKEVYKKLCAEWQELNEKITLLIESGKE